MRFISTRVHGMMDYVLGLLLIAAPWVIGFADGGAETWVPVILGAGMIVYSLMTAYEAGVVPMLSMPAHLGLDAAGGLLLLVSPWIFQFAEMIWWPHVLFGLIELGTVALTETVPRHLPHHGSVRREHHTPTV